MVKRYDESKLEQFTRNCLGWAKIIEVERVLAAHWRVAQQNAPYTDVVALVDMEDFTREYVEIRRDQEIIAGVLEIAVQIGYGPQAGSKPRPEVFTREEGVKRHIGNMLQDLYQELDAAVETGIYEEVKLYAESLLGVADLTLRPNPEFHDLLEEALEKTERAYRAYVKKAEVKEGKAIENDFVKLADKYQRDLANAENEIRTLGKILKQLQYKKGRNE